jgi:hypothetical protein
VFEMVSLPILLDREMACEPAALYSHYGPRYVVRAFPAAAIPAATLLAPPSRSDMRRQSPTSHAGKRVFATILSQSSSHRTTSGAEDNAYECRCLGMQVGPRAPGKCCVPSCMCSGSTNQKTLHAPSCAQWCMGHKSSCSACQSAARCASSMRQLRTGSRHGHLATSRADALPPCHTRCDKRNKHHDNGIPISRGVAGDTHACQVQHIAAPIMHG